MQEEMAQRDVLTANRDKRIWALAHGRDLTVDDSNLPPVTPFPPTGPAPIPTAPTFISTPRKPSPR